MTEQLIFDTLLRNFQQGFFYIIPAAMVASYLYRFR